MGKTVESIEDDLPRGVLHQPRWQLQEVGIGGGRGRRSGRRRAAQPELDEADRLEHLLCRVRSEGRELDGLVL